MSTGTVHQCSGALASTVSGNPVLTVEGRVTLLDALLAIGASDAPVPAEETVSDACLLLSYRRRVEADSYLRRRHPRRGCQWRPRPVRPPGSGGVGVEWGWFTGEQREHRAAARWRVWRGLYGETSKKQSQPARRMDSGADGAAWPAAPGYRRGSG